MNEFTKDTKIVLGQYFTRQDLWMKPQVEEFISQSECSIAYDPFAGRGDLLQAVMGIGNITQLRGMDIDPALRWSLNDSLNSIPPLANAIIITNPPYLAKFSAKRKNLHQTVEKYYRDSGYVDVYQLALHNCLMSADYVVAIIPETFINSGLAIRNRLCQITVLEENPFHDTENPVCVACFDNRIKDFNDVSVYKNSDYIGTLGYLESIRLEPHNAIPMRFNDPTGQIALRAVDSPDPGNPIRFMPTEELDYNMAGIKHSSRLITIISLDHSYSAMIPKIISEANYILGLYRQRTDDLLLSPFKGNQKNGVRRRRLDYRSARAIIELAVSRSLPANDPWRIDFEKDYTLVETR